jgi:D-glycero-D-manno-heptose 1,7-bisphosphate phosphatase
MKRAVFLDRDGVLNRSLLIQGVPKPPNSIEDVEILPGVHQAIQILKKSHFVPVVVTNQPDVARGISTQQNVEAINSYIGAATDIEYFYTCFHDDFDLCECRKPSPGLIYQASLELGLSIRESFMVGDRWRDVAAGQTAGCQSFFIDYSYSETQPKMPYRKVSSLLEAVHLILEKPYDPIY